VICQFSVCFIADLGPGDAKKPFGVPAGSAEPFKFGAPTANAGGAFKFGATDGEHFD
jgi:hypothetical protein